VVHLESVASHTPPQWQGSHTSGGAARADTPFISPPATVSTLDPLAAVSRLDSPAAVSRLDLSRYWLVGSIAVTRLRPPAAVCLGSLLAVAQPLPRRCPAAASATAAAKAKAKATHRHFRSGVGQSERGHLAEAEPTAPAARSEAAGFL